MTGFTLDLGFDQYHIPIVCEDDLHVSILGYKGRVMADRAEARAWDLEGRALGLW